MKYFKSKNWLGAALALTALMGATAGTAQAGTNFPGLGSFEKAVENGRDPAAAQSDSDASRTGEMPLTEISDGVKPCNLASRDAKSNVLDSRTQSVSFGSSTGARN